MNAIDARAAELAVRISQGPLGASEQTELDAWLAVDARHRGALVRAQSAWLDLDRLAALSGEPNRVNSDSRAPAVSGSEAPAARGSCVTSGRVSARDTASTERRWFLAAGLSALTLAGGAGGWWAWRSRGELYESAVGEVRRVTLADGSTLILDTATKARVHFTADRRDVELLTGEALFEVAKDSARAFVVHAGTVSVRAVGTVFGVRAVGPEVAVTVTEGVVEVARPDAVGSATPQRVTASERAVVTAGQGIRVQPVTAAQVERRFAWRDGMLAFDGESLGEAVAEINRYSRQEIVIDDPALAARQVVGLFRASDTQGFADTVAAALGAESVDQDAAIHLRARTAR